ncbi:hypothetical protein F0562_028662 [Nyssa sinensis]|uniref:Uncharacterized protein n=1 Tax=Nyssa sinensis TaxID=561372 RepID=A0A5J5B0P5_9ASTE|nr:hypothetical protein F0562_028662 [Nyssa sinensis]
MEAHRLKDKIIEQQQSTCKEEQEENQMRLFQVSLSRRKPHKSSPKIKQRKLLNETLGKLFEIKEMLWGLQFRPKKVVSGNTSKSRSCKRKWATVYDLYDHVETTSFAMERAQEVPASLAAKFPSFVKSMLPSNVTGGFWLSLPRPFCDLHLPGHDTAVILVDESGAEYTTKTCQFKVYIVRLNGLDEVDAALSLLHLDAHSK